MTAISTAQELCDYLNDSPFLRCAPEYTVNHDLKPIVGYIFTTLDRDVFMYDYAQGKRHWVVGLEVPKD